MKSAPLVTGAVAVAMMAAGAGQLPPRLVYNGSASAPLGLYWIDYKGYARGETVLVAAPESVRILIAERGYLPPDTPLIKRVAAVHGDEICRDDVTVAINGEPVATAKRRDGAGRNMPVWRGCRVLSEAEIFLLQDHPDSFDGRYFGPVDADLVTGRAHHIRVPWRGEGGR